jgi:hypothetical protein
VVQGWPQDLRVGRADRRDARVPRRSVTCAGLTSARQRRVASCGCCSGQPVTQTVPSFPPQASTCSSRPRRSAPSWRSTRSQASASSTWRPRPGARPPTSRSCSRHGTHP